MSQKIRFERPPDYQAVNVAEAATSSCETEDLDGQEMWLIRIPASFDIERLNGKEMDVNDWSINQFQTSKEDLTYVCASSHPAELSEMSIVFPNKGIGKMMAVSKPLAGLCCLHKDLTLPFPTTPVSNKVKLETPNGLKARFVPFGAASPRFGYVKQVKKRAKSPKPESVNETKLHKAKKRKRQNSESSSHDKHKSPKKKKKSKEKD